MELKPHPLAENLPSMTDSEFADLKADIKAYGQRVPIIVDAKCRILDGVHRWKICGSDVKTELWRAKTSRSLS